MDFDGTPRFQIVRQLGAGGMGVVYEAIDAEQGERVALKTLQEMEPEALFRFKREFRTLHGIEHPNLVKLGELVEHGGVWFFTMELVLGKDFLRHVWTRDWRDVSKAAASAVTVADGEAPTTTEAPAVAPPGEVAFDEPRLRVALAQLAAAISAIHAAGKVHRDVKPSNVSVAPDGRLVLLDFGLITGTVQGDRSTVAGLCGTPEYMAPEQISDGRVGPAADWYSFGVILYEALTGRLPIKGTAVTIMADKLLLEPSPPHAFAPDAPRDLDELCVELLRIDPAARPGGREIVARLAAGVDSEAVPSVPARASQSPFVGRKDELTALDGMWGTFRRDRRATTVFVDAVSGMGKTALLTATTRRLALAEPGIVLLEGRGYQHESIPYNVFDHVIDALSRFLRGLSAAKAAEVMPRNAWLLPRLFPILARVGPISRLTRAMNLELDAQELRSRCFAAFRELLARIAERQPLVLVLDDLQWAGRDSLMLLGEIMRPPDPPPMFLVLASRDRELPDPSSAPGGASRRWWALPDDLPRISLGPLPPADATTLAGYLIDRAGVAGLDAGALAAEAEGHPLLMQELVRYGGLAVGNPRAQRPRLDDAVRSRTRAMSSDAKRALSLVVVAGGPIARRLLGVASGLAPDALGDELLALEKAYLVRPARVHAAGAVEPFHDRVRDAVLADLTEEEQRGLHAALAAAIEQASDGDAVELTRHLLAAGETQRAAKTALLAAETAERALAFDRAAEYYKLAFELRRGHPSGSDIRVKFAEALARAGRCREAADAYDAASRASSGAEALELEGCAARQLVRAGEFDRGMTRVRHVLASIGVRLPSSGRGALLRVLLIRLVLRLRGLGVTLRDARAIPADAIHRVDLLHDFSIVTGGVDQVTGAWLTTRTLLEALRVGEPSRVARALALEAAWLAGMVGGRSARVDELLGRVTSLDPGDGRRGWIETARGGVEFVSSRFAHALVHFSRGRDAFVEEAATQFELAAVDVLTTFTLFAMGRIVELGDMATARLRVALDAGDRFHAAFNRVGPANVATWLAADQPSRALDEAGVALTTWQRDSFDSLAFLALLARVENALYVGAGERAWSEVERSWRALSQSTVLAVPWTRVLALDLRGRAALLASMDGRDGALAREAARTGARLASGKSPSGVVRGALLLAGVASARGAADEERRQLKRALDLAESLSMGAHAAAARRRVGSLQGGETGGALVATADAWFRGQRIQRPDRWASMLVPSRGAPASG